MTSSFATVKTALERYERNNDRVVCFGVVVSAGEDGKKIIKPPSKWSSFGRADKTRLKSSSNGLAFRTGSVTGLLVVDVDDVAEFRQWLTAHNLPEPDTVTQRSQSGGLHYFFEYEPRFAALKSTSKVLKDSTGKKLDVDLRSDGGMILVAPTRVAYADGTVKAYEWLPGKGFGERALSRLPEGLWCGLLAGLDPVTKVAARGKGSQSKTTSAITTAAAPTTEVAGLPPSLVDFIMDNYGFLPDQLEKLVPKPDTKTFVVQTSERKCVFYRKAHSSNHQYFVIHANGEITRQCHDGDCKGKELGRRALDDTILQELHALFSGDDEPVDAEIVETALFEAKQHVNENFDGNLAMKMTADKDVFKGEMVEMFGNNRCPLCKVGAILTETTGSGSVMHCSSCTFRLPSHGAFAIPPTRYPNLTQYFIVYAPTNSNNTTNNTVNNYHGQTPETVIGWNEFASDGLKILEDDAERNLLLLKSLAGTQTRVADVFHATFGSRYMFGNKQWYKFESPVWAKVSEADVKFDVRSNEFLGLYTQALEVYKSSAAAVTQKEQKVKEIQRVLTKLETDGFQGSVVSQIVARYSKQFPEFLTKLDQDKGILGFTNGVVVLATGEFREGLPSDYISITVGYEYDQSKMSDPEVTEEIMDFFGKVFPDPDVMKYTLKFLASLLAGYTKDQLFHFGYGTGSNGKGVLLQLMQAVLGDLAQKAESSFICGAVPDANAPTPALTALVGKRFVYVSEVVEGAKINETLFKQLSGQDRMTYRPLYGEARTFMPDFKLFMVCNNLPKFNGADFAMKRRIRVIPFVSTFTNTEEAKESPRSEFSYAKDDTLMGRVHEWKHAMMGILLKYYREYLKTGLDNPPTGVVQDSADYMESNDILERFKVECLVADPAGRIKTDHIMRACEEFCRVNGFEMEGRYKVLAKLDKKLGVGDSSKKRNYYDPQIKDMVAGYSGWKVI